MHLSMKINKKCCYFRHMWSYIRKERNMSFESNSFLSNLGEFYEHEKFWNSRFSGFSIVSKIGLVGSLVRSPIKRYKETLMYPLIPNLFDHHLLVKMSVSFYYCIVEKLNWSKGVINVEECQWGQNVPHRDSCYRSINTDSPKFTGVC